jgi:hypothetical protein
MPNNAENKRPRDERAMGYKYTYEKTSESQTSTSKCLLELRSLSRGVEHCYLMNSNGTLPPHLLDSLKLIRAQELDGDRNPSREGISDDDLDRIQAEGYLTF